MSVAGPVKQNAALDCKVVLLGKEHVGKTCIMERFVHERYLADQTESQSTVGVVFGAKQIILNDKTVRLSLWDTAGSERFTSISRLYYRNAKAAVLCYDLTDTTSLDRCLFWIEELRKTEDQCRIYLVGTKSDLVAANPRTRKVSSADVEKLAKELSASSHETSSRTGSGISELFTIIASDYMKSLPPSALLPAPVMENVVTVSSDPTTIGGRSSRQKSRKSNCCS